MGFLDRLLGREDQQQQRQEQPQSWGRQAPASDEAAIERYRYLLRTAPPEAIEQAHAEAFAQLTPEQRKQVLDGLSQDVPEAERARSDDPRALARMATRAEMRAPGTLENRLGFAIGLATSEMVNKKAAESRIRDANIAEESANMTRYNILNQSGIAALAQANQSSASVLSLLR